MEIIFHQLLMWLCVVNRFLWVVSINLQFAGLPGTCSSTKMVLSVFISLKWCKMVRNRHWSMFGPVCLVPQKCDPAVICNPAILKVSAHIWVKYVSNAPLFKFYKVFIFHLLLHKAFCRTFFLCFAKSALFIETYRVVRECHMKNILIQWVKNNTPEKKAIFTPPPPPPKRKLILKKVNFPDAEL